MVKIKVSFQHEHERRAVLSALSRLPRPHKNKTEKKKGRTNLYLDFTIPRNHDILKANESQESTANQGL